MRPHLCHGWCHLCSQVEAKVQGPVGFEVCPPEGSRGRTQIPSGWGGGASLGLGGGASGDSCALPGSDASAVASHVQSARTSRPKCRKCRGGTWSEP